MNMRPYGLVLPALLSSFVIHAPLVAQVVAESDATQVATESGATQATSTGLFHAPMRLKAGGEFIRTEQPGYAAPTWFDVDGDGKKDLVVGQFNGGKMMIYRNLGDGKLAKGEWLKAGDKVAIVPGVW